MLKKISLIMLVLMVLTGARMAWLLHANPVPDVPLYHIGDTVPIYHSEMTLLEAAYTDAKDEERAANLYGERVQVRVLYRFVGEKLDFAAMIFLRAGNATTVSDHHVDFLGNNLVARTFWVPKKYIKKGEPFLLHIEPSPKMPKDIEHQPPVEIDLQGVLPTFD